MKLFVVTLMLAVAAVAADGRRSSGLSSSYGAPRTNGGGASQSYGAPQGNSGASQSYGAPQGNSGASQSYGAPQGNSGASQRYGAPQGNSRQSFQSNGSSQRNTGQASQGYGAPQSNNNQASHSYGGQQAGQQNSYGTAEESYPPQPYSFEYNVQDNQGNDYGHKEESDGSRVEGEYRVLLPDSRMQTVTYYVEGDSGFVAEVTYEGEAQFPEEEQDGQYGQGNTGYGAPSSNAGYSTSPLSSGSRAGADSGLQYSSASSAGGASGHQYGQSSSAAGAAPSTGYGAPGGGSRSQTPTYGSAF